MYKRQLQNKVTCPCCGKQMEIDATFCSHCGMKLTKDEAPAEEPAAQPEQPAEAPEQAPAEGEEEKTEE